MLTSCLQERLQQEREHGTKAKRWISELLATATTGREDESTLVIWSGLDQIGFLELGFGSVLDMVLRSTALRCVALLYELGLPGVVALWNGVLDRSCVTSWDWVFLGWFQLVALISSIVLRLIPFCT